MKVVSLKSIEPVRPMFHKMAEEFAPEVSASIVDQYVSLTGPRERLILALEVANCLVGFLTLSVSEPGKKGLAASTLTVDDFYLEPKWRKTLASAELLREVVAYAKANSYTRIEGVASNKKLVRYWKTFGFKPLPGDKSAARDRDLAAEPAQLRITVKRLAKRLACM